MECPLVGGPKTLTPVLLGPRQAGIPGIEQPSLQDSLGHKHLGRSMADSMDPPPDTRIPSLEVRCHP